MSSTPTTTGPRAMAKTENTEITGFDTSPVLELDEASIDGMRARELTDTPRDPI